MQEGGHVVSISHPDLQPRVSAVGPVRGAVGPSPLEPRLWG